MGLHLITAPTDDVVTADEAREQLRLPASVTDGMIEAMIAAASQQLDPAWNGWLGRALRPQTWELRLPGFPYDCRVVRGDAIYLPYPPLLLVDSFKYDDGDGVERTLAESTGYRVMGGGIGKSYLVPPYNGAWPSSVRCDDESVRVRFTAGYENLTAGDTLPSPIKQAIMLMVKHLNGLGERNLFISSEDVPGLGSRSYVVSENAAKVMREAAENLLSTLRVYE